LLVPVAAAPEVPVDVEEPVTRALVGLGRPVYTTLSISKRNIHEHSIAFEDLGEGNGSTEVEEGRRSEGIRKKEEGRRKRKRKEKEVRPRKGEAKEGQGERESNTGEGRTTK
jgi:hypothetical protein